MENPTDIQPLTMGTKIEKKNLTKEKENPDFRSVWFSLHFFKAYFSLYKMNSSLYKGITLYFLIYTE